MVGWVSFRLSLEQQLANLQLANLSLQLANLPGPTELETHLAVRPLNLVLHHVESYFGIVWGYFGTLCVILGISFLDHVYFKNFLFR